MSECHLRLLASPVAGDHLALLVAVGGDADAAGLALVAGRLRTLADSASAHGRELRVVAASRAAQRALRPAP